MQDNKKFRLAVAIIYLTVFLLLLSITLSQFKLTSNINITMLLGSLTIISFVFFRKAVYQYLNKD